MTIQTINLGSYANDGSGDDLRTAFTKVNSNFSFLNATAAIASGTNLGAGAGVFADKNGTNLEFKSLTSTGNSVAITSTASTIDLEAVTTLSSDLVPTLGGDLNLNGYYTYGGDSQTTVYGHSVPANTVLNSLLIESNNLNVDMGSMLSPTGYQNNYRGYTFDWGMFSDNPINNQLNFGSFTDHLSGGIGQLTLAGNLTTIGANNLTLTTTANTNLTLPTSGTLTTTANNLSAFAATTSAQLASVISDKTGSGYAVFSSSPVLSGTVSAGSISASGTINVTGLITANGGINVTGTLSATSPSFATSVTTPSTSFNLYNTTATTINAFQAATTISIGASTGTTTINNNLAITGTSTLSNTLFFSSQTVSAAGTNQGTATAVTADNVFVTGGTGGIILPSATSGREISITNNTASSINVYPASGHTIENSAANVATSLPAYATLGLIAKSGTNWWTSQPVYAAGTGVSITQAANGTVTWSIGQAVSTTSNVTFANVATTGLTLRNVNFIPVASTATYALSTTTSYNVLVVSTTGLTVTVTMPPSPVDQQLCSFTIASNTVSTLNMTAGPTVIPPFTGTANVTSGTVYQYVYRASTTTWYRN